MCCTMTVTSKRCAPRSRRCMSAISQWRTQPLEPPQKPLFLATFGEYLPQFNPGRLTPVISYEYPLSERIRTLLRLEDLYERLDYFLGKHDAPAPHLAPPLLFAIFQGARR